MAVAERQRLERSIAESSEEFAEDFFNELRSLAMMLEPRPQAPSDTSAWPLAPMADFVARRSPVPLNLNASTSTSPGSARRLERIPRIPASSSQCTAKAIASRFRELS
jgi:hypothetical protein